MNQAQRRYTLLRLENIRDHAIRSSNEKLTASLPKPISREELYEKVKSSLKANARVELIGDSWSIRNAFRLKGEGQDSEKLRAANGERCNKIRAAYNEAADRVMLGDNSVALTALANFEAACITLLRT